MNKARKINPEGEALLRHFHEDVDAAMLSVYRTYRAPFLNWVEQHFQLDESSAQDIFQEVALIFFLNIKKQKLTKLEASPKTYLFSIGRNIILQEYRKKQKQKTVSFDKLAHLDLVDWDFDLSGLEQQSRKEEELIAAIELLGTSCKCILKYFYFHSFSHEKIAAFLNYNSSSVSRSMKKKCIQQLRKLIRPTEEG